ncbi:putative low complexity protein [Cystoisospora suis]|uniref:Putative low complexity protein n=1 Tax=Cystoisospora suis TaxID=483139 RepID=A0A2C6L3L6_9APIC|nr:putative low complexity protein [Cystoisospora suis]
MESSRVIPPTLRLYPPNSLSSLNPGSSKSFYSRPTRTQSPDPSSVASQRLYRGPSLTSGEAGGAGKNGSFPRDAIAHSRAGGSRAGQNAQFASPFFQENAANDPELALHLATKGVLGEEPVRYHIPRGNFSFTRPTHLFVPYASSSAAESASSNRGGDSIKADDSLTSDRGSYFLSAASRQRWQAAPPSQTSVDTTDPKQPPTESTYHLCISRKDGGSRFSLRETQEAGEGAAREETQDSEAATPRLRRGKVPVPSMTENEVLLFTRDTDTLPKTRDTRCVASKMRARNTLFCYALLDPYDQGYIDVQEACDLIGSIHKQDRDVAELLLSILQDMLTFVSARGVIEKEDFLTQVLIRIEADLAGTTPYFSLRSTSNPVAVAWRRGKPFTTVLNRKFYKGNYIPRGVELHLKQAEGASSVDVVIAQRGGGGATIRASTPAGGNVQVEGTLEDHILRGRQRRERKLQRIKDEIVRREQAECTFHPKTTPAPPQSEPFPPRALIREMIRQQDRAARRDGAVVIEHADDPNVTHDLALPPDLNPTEKDTVMKNLCGRDDRPPRVDGTPGRVIYPRKPGGLVSPPAGGRGETPTVPEGTDEGVSHWILHNGDPPMRPVKWGDTLKVSRLPAVPLDDDWDQESEEVQKLIGTWSPIPGKKADKEEREETPGYLPKENRAEKSGAPLPTPRAPSTRGLVPFGDIFIQSPYVSKRDIIPTFDMLALTDGDELWDDEALPTYPEQRSLKLEKLPDYYRNPLERLVAHRSTTDGGKLTTEARKQRLEECLRLLQDDC